MVKKKGEKTPICVCNLAHTIYFMNGSIDGKPIIGEVFIKHAPFCQTKDTGVWENY